MLETILTFHSILSDRFRLFRGKAQPVLSMTASVKQHARKEPTIVHGDAPQSPPFGVTRRRSQMSNILCNRAQRERRPMCKTRRPGDLENVVSQGICAGLSHLPARFPDCKHQTQVGPVLQMVVNIQAPHMHLSSLQGGHPVLTTCTYCFYSTSLVLAYTLKL